jgi:AAA15 family ATPase/GTPase
VIKSLVISFIKEIDLQRFYNFDNLDIFSFIFQQDNTLVYKSYWTLKMLQNADIEVLEHLGNSPDINTIEKT